MPRGEMPGSTVLRELVGQIPYDLGTNQSPYPARGYRQLLLQYWLNVDRGVLTIAEIAQSLRHHRRVQEKHDPYDRADPSMIGLMNLPQRMVRCVREHRSIMRHLAQFLRRRQQAAPRRVEMVP